MFFTHKKNKKGQTTLFIIIGILILIGVGLFIFTSEKDTSDRIATEQQVSEEKSIIFKNVEQAVADCLRISSDRLLNLAIRQGGFIHPDKGYEYIWIDQNYQVPVYTACGTNYLPDIEEMKVDIERATEAEFLRCFATMEEEMKYHDISYDGEKIKIEYSFNDASTGIIIELPITANNTEHEFTKQAHRVEHNIPFLELYKKSIKFLNETARYESIFQMANRFGLDIDPMCGYITDMDTNLYIKNLNGEYSGSFDSEFKFNSQKTFLDLIQIADFRQIDDTYMFQFLMRHQNFKNGTGCYNVPDIDLDLKPDSKDSCDNTSKTLTYLNGCSCEEMNCTNGAFCVESFGKPKCVADSDLDTHNNFANRLRDAPSDFLLVHKKDETIVNDCEYDDLSCPYTRKCVKNGAMTGYYDAEEDWKDECKIGEILVDTKFKEKEALITSGAKTKIGMSSNNANQFIKNAVVLDNYHAPAGASCNHDEWEFEFPGARWIWDSADALNGAGNTVHFEEEVIIGDITKIASINMRISIDGSTSVLVNNIGVASVSSHYGSVCAPTRETKQNLPVSAFKNGVNKITFRATGSSGSNTGIQYRIEIKERGSNKLEYKCCSGGNRTYEDYAHHAKIDFWSLQGMQDDCKHQAPGQFL